MPPLTDQGKRRNVVREWILGFSRDSIAERNGIGAGTVSSIIANYKTGLEELDFHFDSFLIYHLNACIHRTRIKE